MDSSDFLRAINKETVKLAKQQGLPVPPPCKTVEPDLECSLKRIMGDESPVLRREAPTKFYRHSTATGPRAQGTMGEIATIETTRLTDRQEALKTCKRCGLDIFKMACPTGWPINTVAIICAHCARTKGYYDEVTDDGFIFVKGRE